MTKEKNMGKKLLILLCFLLVLALLTGVYFLSLADRGEIPAVSPSVKPTVVGEPSGVSYDLIRIQSDNKFGYANLDGEIVIEPKFHQLSAVASDGLIAFGNSLTTDCKRGYINTAGEVVIEPRFDSAQDFSEGLAAVHIGDGWGYINTKGETVIPLKFDYAGSFQEGLACVELVDNNVRKYACINQKGDYVIEPSKSYVGEFHDGLASVRQENQYGYVDKTGKFVIEPQFTYAGNFSEGYAAVRIGEKWGYINQKGEYLVEPQFAYGGSFSDGFAKVYGDDTFYLDREGKIHPYPEYDTLFDYCHGFALVHKGDKMGYIDVSGNFITNEEIAVAYDFVSPYYAVVALKDKTFGVVNTKGELIMWGYEGIGTCSGPFCQVDGCYQYTIYCLGEEVYRSDFCDEHTPADVPRV
ncbi:MAG: WG repeat-containing protein [Clostridia bacterium]|nr:WG repeat-containing protein [Clostridia bacterium]